MRKILFSVSKVKVDNPKAQVEFDGVEAEFGQIAEAACLGPWSPCVWSGGRKVANFRSADVVALDFDGGVSLRTIAERVAALGLAAIIMTTKSHRKPKNGVVDERFRLVVPAARVSTAVEYEWMMTQAMAVFPEADRACRDAARFFYRSVAVVAAWEGGDFKWPEYKEPPKQEPRQIAAIGKGRVAPSVARELSQGCPPGGRHRQLYKNCYYLGAQGVSFDEALLMVRQSGYSLPWEEQEKVLRHGWRKGYETGRPS